MTILCASDESTARFLSLVLDGPVQTTASFPGGLTEGAVRCPHLLVIGAAANLDAALLASSLLLVGCPGTVIVLLRDELDPAVRKRAVQAGIREVLDAGDAEAIARACRAAEVEKGDGGEDRRAGVPDPELESLSIAEQAGRSPPLAPRRLTRPFRDLPNGGELHRSTRRSDARNVPQATPTDTA